MLLVIFNVFYNLASQGFQKWSSFSIHLSSQSSYICHRWQILHITLYNPWRMLLVILNLFYNLASQGFQKCSSFSIHLSSQSFSTSTPIYCNYTHSLRFLNAFCMSRSSHVLMYFIEKIEKFIYTLFYFVTSS